MGGRQLIWHHSTDTLRLEWSFNSQQGTPPSSLHIQPHWDPRHPSVHVSYEAVIPSHKVVPVEVIIPDGWGWSELSFKAAGLIRWISTDGDWWDETVTPINQPDDSFDLPTQDDSFSTTKGKSSYLPAPSSSQSSASLMRQTLPVPADMRMEDFSFELSGPDSPPARPVTPSVWPVTPLPRERVTKSRFVPPRDPLPGRLFDLHFDGVQEGSLTLQGSLVPSSPLTLVSPAVPLQLPFVHTDHPTSCRVTCEGARYPDMATSDQHICDTARYSIGTLEWTDRGRSISQRKSEVQGDVRVRLQRNTWNQSMSILLPWPRRANEVAFTLMSPESVRIQRAMLGGTALPRSLTRSSGEVEVRLGASGKEGMAEVVLEFEGEETPLPRFAGAAGTMTVEFRGDGWDSTSPSSESVPLLINFADGRLRHRKDGLHC